MKNYAESRKKNCFCGFLFFAHENRAEWIIYIRKHVHFDLGGEWRFDTSKNQVEQSIFARKRSASVRSQKIVHNFLYSVHHAFFVFRPVGSD